MKNIKNVFSTILIALSCINFGSMLNAEPNVELNNKAKNLISVFLNRNGNLIAGANIPAGEKWNYTLEQTSPPFSIEIRDNNKKSEWAITNAASNTYYVSYDPTKSIPLYPQTGTLMGLTGKSSSGYSLKNNLKASNISLMVAPTLAQPSQSQPQQQTQSRQQVLNTIKMQTLQRLLGLPFSTNAQETKKAYFAYALKNHPDKVPNQTAEQLKKYKEVSEAYSDIKDALQEAIQKEQGL